MKEEIHPEYTETVIQCTCGNVVQTRSTKANMHIGICSACHPFFTGEQRFVDTAGRVDKFSKRYGDQDAAKKRRKKPKLSDLQPAEEEVAEDAAVEGVVAAEVTPEVAAEATPEVAAS